MSVSVELQTLIFDTLVADTTVGALVGDRIYDGMPQAGTYPCVTFGPSDYSPEDSQCITGRVETIQLHCWAQSQGRLRPAREIADAVKAALHEADLELTVNALISIEVSGVRVMGDPDGVTAHGVVSVTAEIEEA